MTLLETWKAKARGKKSLAFSVAIKGLKSLIVDFTNKSLKTIERYNRKRNMEWTTTKEKRGRMQI